MSAAGRALVGNVYVVVVMSSYCLNVMCAVFVLLLPDWTCALKPLQILIYV